MSPLAPDLTRCGDPTGALTDTVYASRNETVFETALRAALSGAGCRACVSAMLDAGAGLIVRLRQLRRLHQIVLVAFDPVALQHAVHGSARDTERLSRAG